MKKMMIMSILLISTFVLFACGDNNKSTTTLLLYARDFEDWSNEHLEDLINEFNNTNEDGIEVDLRLYGEATYMDALNVARENNKNPDLYMLTYADMFNHARNGYIAQLDDVMPTGSFDGVFDEVEKMITYAGKIYAFPWLLEPGSMFYYRKDILAAAGVTGEIKTWDDLFDACSRVKPRLNLGQYTLGLPTGIALGWATWGMQYNTGGTLAVDDTWMINLVDSKSYEDLSKFFFTVYDNGYAPAAPLTPDGYPDVHEALCQDKLAMTFAGSWAIADFYQYYPEYVDKIGVSPIPTQSGDHSKATSTNGGWTYVVSDSSTKKDLASKFLEWMFLDDVERTAQYFIKAHNSKAPTTQEVSDFLNTVDTGVNPDWVSVVNDVASKAIPEPLYPWDITNEVLKLFQTMQVSSNETNVFQTVYQPAIATAKANIDTILSRTSHRPNPNS